MPTAGPQGDGVRPSPAHSSSSALVFLAGRDAGRARGALRVGRRADLPGDAEGLLRVAVLRGAFQLPEQLDHLARALQVPVEARLERFRRVELPELADALLGDRPRLPRIPGQLLYRARFAELADPLLRPLADRRGAIDELGT